MGSLKFDCPLCCNETFTSQQTLKYHLLSIIDNILCSICSSRFESIYELAKHLDEECGKTIQEAANSNFDCSSNVHIKIEDNGVENQDDISTSILAKALLSPQKNVEHLHHTNLSESETNNLNNNEGIVGEEMDSEDVLHEEDVEGVKEVTEEDVYTCSSCGISFTSIIDHIQEYHAGQEVVIESNDAENDGTENLISLNPEDSNDLLSNLPEGATLIASDGVVLKEFSSNLEEDVDSNESQDINESNNRVRMPQILNTLKQEDCIDKDGRLYTRKVVQIEKFWDDEPNKLKSPLILKYLVNNDGTLVKMNDGDHLSELIQMVEMYQCRSCGVQFSKREQYDMHACDPEIGSEYKCSMCEASFTNAQSLSVHMKIHKNPKKSSLDDCGPFVCNVCDTVFPTNKSLRLHRRMHEPVKSKEIEAPVEYGLMGNDIGNSKPREMFECKICRKKYDKSYEQMHMTYHSGVNHYDCYICNRKFYTHSNLEMHMRVHGNEKGQQCQHCKKKFASLETLEQHLKQHCSNRPYQCSYCSRRFARPHEKVKHERIHTGEKPHECEICGKTFRVSYCLTLHMRTHSGFRPYVCQHCGKRFKAHSVYNHHLLTHSDVRAYKCPYCPKAFKTGVQLAGHKNSHTKPFSCTQCNRPFASLYAVRAHMETHKRENNLKYNCYLCGASYARAFALRDHIKEQHVDSQPEGTSVSLDIIEEGMEATRSILPDNDMTMVTLEEIATVSEIDEETNDQ